jgi:hypothetical protein
MTLSCSATIGFRSKELVTLLTGQSSLPCSQQPNTASYLETVAQSVPSQPVHVTFTSHLLLKVKQSRYTPWRRLGGEEV